MENVPGYVSIVFILTTFAAIAFLLQAVKAAGLQNWPANVLLFVLPLWVVFQTVLAISGFYQATDVVPPRMFIFGVGPAALFIALYFAFFRDSFVAKLPIKHLTLLHAVRVPVELVLFWLYEAALVPRIMTFDGWNFDILSGVLGVLVYVALLVGTKFDRLLLIAFNLTGLLLLVIIVTIAVVSLQTPLQQLAFEQPNRAVLFFPYSYLPNIVVPIVLFSHIAGLYKSLRGNLQ